MAKLMMAMFNQLPDEDKQAVLDQTDYLVYKQEKKKLQQQDKPPKT